MPSTGLLQQGSPEFTEGRKTNGKRMVFLVLDPSNL